MLRRIKRASRIEARNRLESQLYRLTSTLRENREKISNKEDLKEPMDSIDEMMEVSKPAL